MVSKNGENIDVYCLPATNDSAESRSRGFGGQKEEPHENSGAKTDLVKRESCFVGCEVR
jgi:hypothetical protein